MGVRKGRSLARQHGLPFVPVHHMEAHALTVRQARSVPFPYLSLLVSGGHTMLLTVHGVGDYTLLGSSLDDSVGACTPEPSECKSHKGSPAGSLLPLVLRQALAHTRLVRSPSFAPGTFCGLTP